MDEATKSGIKDRTWLRALIIVGGFFGILFFYMYVVSDPVKNALIAQPAEAARQDDNKVTPERFTAVSKVFIDFGCTVEPFNPEYPATMRVILPIEAALKTDPKATRELAGIAHTRLGKDAVVYVKTPAGQTLAKASAWGIE